jgi:rhamnosyltransferase
MTLASSRHPTWRLYWIARNGMILLREHRRTAPRWALGTAAYFVQWVLVRTLVEAPRGQRLAVMARGFRDGWSGRTTDGYLPADAFYQAETAGTPS